MWRAREEDNEPTQSGHSEVFGGSQGKDELIVASVPTRYSCTCTRLESCSHASYIQCNRAREQNF